ncbi:hypothetical protein M5D96_008940, partial [Drosophila gunungcola]
VDQWLREELRRLQSSGLVQFEQQTQWQQKISNGFNDWLKQQRNGSSYQEFVDFLKRDKQRLDGIASDYHVTVEQVEKWLHNTGRPDNNWRNQERKRLREVATAIVITEQELLEFISQDMKFQTQLAHLYQVGLVQLAPVQRIFIGNMAREQLLEQRPGTYEISEQQLKDWQKQELERIKQLAQYYGMSQSDLQQFREGELLHLAYENHRTLMSVTEVQKWESRHQWCLKRLQSRYGKFGDDADGGYVLDPGSTNATAVYKPIFSKERGDQPPHTYGETFDEGDEPGLEGEMSLPRPPHPSPIMSTSTPVPQNKGGPVGGYEYRRTASSSASGGAAGSFASASATMGKWNRSAGDEPSQQEEDPSEQQQVEDLGWNGNLEGLEQQKQVEDPDWNQQFEDLGQQQAQMEEEATAEPSFWEKLKGKLG